MFNSVLSTAALAWTLPSWSHICLNKLEYKNPQTLPNILLLIQINFLFLLIMEPNV